MNVAEEVSVKPKSFLTTFFALEFSSAELEDENLNRKYIFPENNFVWLVKRKKGITNSLILESCKNIRNIISITVSMFLYSDEKSEWEDKPQESKVMTAFNLIALPLTVMDFSILKKKFEIKICVRGGDSCLNCNDMCETVQYYGSLMKNEEYSDVALIVENEKFLSHKVILTTRSSVFAGMFQTDMLENQNGVVKVENIKKETFKLLLEYFYTGQIGVDKNDYADVNWLDLMLAADYHGIDGLKRICSVQLYEHLNAENAVDILILSDRLRDEKLKKTSISFIITNKHRIFNTEKYKELMKSNSELALEILNDFMSSDYSAPKRMKLGR